MKYTINVLCGEYPITIEGSVTDELPGEGFFASLADYLRNEALIPVDTAPALAGNSRSRELGPKPQSVGAGYSAQGGAPAPARPPMRPPAAPQGNWECPVHGNEDIGPGYGGKGMECKVWTADPANDDPNGEWVRLDDQRNYKPAVMRDNSVRYWCRHKSANGGGGGGGRRY